MTRVYWLYCCLERGWISVIKVLWTKKADHSRWLHAVLTIRSGTKQPKNCWFVVFLLVLWLYKARMNIVAQQFVWSSSAVALTGQIWVLSLWRVPTESLFLRTTSSLNSEISGFQLHRLPLHFGIDFLISCKTLKLYPWCTMVPLTHIILHYTNFNLVGLIVSNVHMYMHFLVLYESALYRWVKKKGMTLCERA